MGHYSEWLDESQHWLKLQLGRRKNSVIYFTLGDGLSLYYEISSARQMNENLR
jgi:hypothetical protein